MSKKLADKVAVVTGASKGIGAAIAKHLAAEGAAVVVNYASSKEGADRVVNEIASNGGKAVAVQANVAKQTEIERLATQYRFFHWHLAFPDVFRVPAAGQRPENGQTGWNGGFDLVLDSGH